MTEMHRSNITLPNTVTTATVNMVISDVVVWVLLAKHHVKAIFVIQRIMMKKSHYCILYSVLLYVYARSNVCVCVGVGGGGEGNDRMTKIHTDNISVFWGLFKLKTPQQPHPSYTRMPNDKGKKPRCNTCGTEFSVFHIFTGLKRL